MRRRRDFVDVLLQDLEDLQGLEDPEAEDVRIEEILSKSTSELLKFGNANDELKANLKIKKTNFTFNLIKGGSVGFAESYMRNEFETKNLSNLTRSI